MSPNAFCSGKEKSLLSGGISFFICTIHRRASFEYAFCVRLRRMRSSSGIPMACSGGRVSFFSCTAAMFAVCNWAGHSWPQNLRSATADQSGVRPCPRPRRFRPRPRRFRPRHGRPLPHHGRLRPRPRRLRPNPRRPRPRCGRPRPRHRRGRPGPRPRGGRLRPRRGRRHPRRHCRRRRRARPTRHRRGGGVRPPARNGASRSGEGGAGDGSGDAAGVSRAATVAVSPAGPLVSAATAATAK